VASNRNPKTGGRIPPQGRTPQAPGVGRTAKRHDLERPATPGLSGDLQQGEVSELEQGQAIAPRAGAKQRQSPAQSQGARSSVRGNVQDTTALETPNPIDFAGGRLRGTLGGAAAPEQELHDFSGWFPLMEQLLTTPGTSGPLTRAYMEQLSLLARRPTTSRVAPIDFSALDDSLDAVLGDD
jgi:hypothetical protein